MRDAFYRAPLFWTAAVVVAAVLFIVQFTGLERWVPAQDPARLVADGPRRVHVGGVIVSAVDTRPSSWGPDSASFVLEARRVWLTPQDARPVKGRVRVSRLAPPETPAYGDEIVIEGELSLPDGPRNPGGFDQRRTLAARGIHSVLLADKFAGERLLVARRGNIVYAFTLELRAYFLRLLSRGFSGDDAAFLKALYFGDRSGLGDDLKDLFLRTGTLHILAVSGFNIGFVAALVFGLLKPFRVPRDYRRAFVLAAIWSYCLIVGWQAPVLRASLMASVYLLGEMLGRKGNTLNSLGLAALVLIAFNPLVVLDAGFQLSFLAVWAIAVLVPVFYRRPELLPHERRTLREKLTHEATLLFWVSFVCTMATLPVTVQSFYRVSPAALVANLFVVPLAFLIFVSGAVYMAVAAFLPRAGAMLTWPSEFLTQSLLGCLRAVESVPGASVTVGRLWPAFYAVLLAGVTFLILRPKKLSGARRAIVLGAFTVTVFCAQDLARLSRSELYAAFLDVGQGDAAYFEFPGGTNMLVDAGPPGRGERAVLPFLASRGVRTLDLLVATHPQSDHIGAMPAVLKELRVRRYAGAGTAYASVPYAELGRSVRAEKAPVLLPKRGGSIDAAPGVRVNVYNPDPDAQPSTNVNNDSVVLEIVFAGTRFLMTGDIQDEAIRRIKEQFPGLRADVLKVPHHGARLGAHGAAWVRALRPRFSVISAGLRNPFRHPRPETLAILEGIEGNRVFRTDLDGAVEFRAGPKGLRAAP